MFHGYVATDKGRMKEIESAKFEYLLSLGLIFYVKEPFRVLLLRIEIGNFLERVLLPYQFYHYVA